MYAVQMKKVVVSSMMGNALEWYDYALYGHFSPLLSSLFFPKSSEYAALMSVFAIYLVGFVMRPLGAILLGYVGDKHGRRAALSISVLMMAIPTAMIGILPTYDKIGLWAPVFLTLIRLVQGASMGGEFGGSMVFLVEHAPKERRGFFGSMSVVSLGIGVLTGSSVAYLVSHFLSYEDFSTWGWRVPFMVSILFGFCAFYLRANTEESDVYKKNKKEFSGDENERILSELFKDHSPKMIMGMLLSMAICVPFHCLTVFMGTFVSKILNNPIDNMFLMSTAAVALLSVFCIISAHISDKIGRKKLLFLGSAGVMLWTWPTFWLLEHGSFATQTFAYCVFGIFLGIYFGPASATLVELFPTRVRYTGLSLSYNMSITIFGGTLPMICTWIINSTGINSSASFYIIAVSFFAVVAVLFLKESYKEDLN